MDTNQLHDPTCRVALAAYLHDLGKFAERARLSFDKEALSVHTQLYCRRNEVGGRVWYSHKHAAYTALAWDVLEKAFPELLGDEITPFASWSDRDVDDSIVNAASRHHKPDTFLQWIVATADRVASGFEREEFDKYNAAEDRTETGRNHYTARQLTLFEHIRIEGEQTNTRDQWRFRYPLRPLSPQALFPVPADGYETADDGAAQEEYKQLWEQFIQSLGAIPASHRANWSLWLDHFDSAWACYTQAIPAATAFNVRPEVSLYDHSRTTAALAAALWRYHHERGDASEAVRKGLADYHRPDWDEQKLLLIQGDFFGIQDFIFATGGETQRRAAKLLRGRSFYVSLLTECAALRILDELGLPPTSQVINAAGKFLIVAPNTDETVRTLGRIQSELDSWFLEHTYGQSGIGLAWLPACCNDFLRNRAGGEAPFGALMRRLFEVLNDAKTRRLGLCGDQAPKPVFDRFLAQFDPTKRECAVDGRSPATQPLEGTGRFVSALAADQIEVGSQVARRERVLITTQSLRHHTLGVPIFGYHIQFTGEEDESGRFGEVARSGVLRRAWDFGLPRDAEEALFQGYARRYINAYVPLFGEQNTWMEERYPQRLLQDAEFERRPEEPKTLEHLACDDRWPEADGNYQGIEALVTLKGDVDNLGSIFEKGLAQPSFAKMAGLSRQTNAFFAVWLPWLCRSKYESTYTVFAGGDDFFLIGPWRSTIKLAVEMREQFGRFVAHNPEIHFSTGLAMTKPGLPIRQMGDLAERALEAAKDRRAADGRLIKDAVTCFGHTVGWDAFERLLQIEQHLEDHRQRGELALSTGYLYSLQYLADMAEDLNRAQRDSGHSPRLESALWNSRFTYRTRRMLESRRGLDEDARRRWQKALGELLAEGIRRFGAAFKIALFTHLYHHRH
ncbi:MAG: type III-A CRISPR-associated protein Cas10/Csm1 [Pseudomonadota bacterium]|nr:type III-A CRISPR-associated protein Cas10/Csm1 [Pseudomonadota bacterium]